MNQLQGMMRNISGENTGFSNPISPQSGHAGQSSELPDIVRKFSKEAVASGADLVLCTGPGDVRAIEIIDGRPCFYGLGNFIRNPYLQNIMPMETFTAKNRPRRGGFDPNSTEIADNEIATKIMPPHPRAYFESIIARVHFGVSGLDHISLHPKYLSFDAPISDIGIPRPASPELADRILKRLASRCAAIGTTLDVESGIGIIRPQNLS